MKLTAAQLKCNTGPSAFIHPFRLRATVFAHTPARRATDASGEYARWGEPRPTDPLGGFIRYPLDHDGARAQRVRKVLHIDADAGSTVVLTALLTPDAQVTSVLSLEAARAVLKREKFSLVVIDPSLPDGDGAALLPDLAGTPMLVYSATQPDWRTSADNFLPKPLTSARQLWSAVSRMLGIPQCMTAGD